MKRMKIGEVLNDVTVGEYDVVMDTGPGFQSKRQQAVESMMPLLTGNADSCSTLRVIWCLETWTSLAQM
jgi:hypothetical protein